MVGTGVALEGTEPGDLTNDGLVRVRVRVKLGLLGVGILSRKVVVCSFGYFIVNKEDLKWFLVTQCSGGLSF